jgi:hypothetical protein
MFEFIAMIAAGTSTAVGYLQSRQFVRRRLNYVDAVQRPIVPVLIGAAAAVAATPVVWILPLVGSGTAALFGIGVGAGVAAGARDVRRRLTA